MFDLNETIVAIASPPGGAARGIVRASGPNVLRVVAPLFSADEPCASENIRVPTAIAGHLRRTKRCREPFLQKGSRHLFHFLAAV